MRASAIALLLILGLAACGQKKGPDAPDRVDAGSPAGTDAVTSASGMYMPPPPPPVDAGTSEDEAAPPAAAAPETIVFVEGSKQGKVSFGHAAHESRASCAGCHHETEDGGEEEACRSCHVKGSKDTFDAKKAFHTKCLGCHEEKGSGPVACAGCHSK